MEVILVVSFAAVALSGGAVAATRDPLLQSMVAGYFGLQLTILFLVLQAPDVALSEMVVGAVAYPIMVLLTVTKCGAKGAT